MNLSKGFSMKKATRFQCLLASGGMLIAFIIVMGMSTACVIPTIPNGPNGLAYQKYYWTDPLTYFYDTNQSSPVNISNDVYYATQAGAFYMEYRTANGDSWYLNYTIRVNPGTANRGTGNDNWFEIDLYDSGPVIYLYATDHLSHDLSPIQSTAVNSPQVSLGELGPILGTRSLYSEEGSIEINYGRFR